MNTATNSFDTLLTEMSLALDLAAALEGELKTAAVIAPAPRTFQSPRTAPPALLGFSQPQPAY